MKVEIKEISSVKQEITIIIEADIVLKDYQKSLQKFKKMVAIPGFRKGKAPLSLIERTYADYAKQEFLDNNIDKYFKKALEQEKLNPVNQGTLEDVAWEKGNDLTAKFTIEVMPEIIIENYKNLEIPFEEEKFKSEMVDDYLQKLQSENGYETESDDPSQEGDIIGTTLVFLDDEGNKTSKIIDREFVLGDNAYCDEFNKNLTSVKIGDEIRTILFTKEKPDPDEEISAMFDKEFIVIIDSINKKVLPELDDEFAKDMGIEEGTIESLRIKIEDEIKFNVNKQNDDQLRGAIIAKLIEQNPFELPSAVITRYAENMAKPYVQAYKTDLESILPIYEKLAIYQLKSFYIVDKIEEIEKIEISEEDIEDAIKIAASNMKMEIEKYKELYKKEIKNENFVATLEEKKVFDLIKETIKFIPFPKKEIENAIETASNEDEPESKASEE
ncbi:MAG: trigger factor [Candidatus Cloacimonetes bacterium]|nr:trigger factor [Candidatus Cloacimonadota bacterium]